MEKKEWLSTKEISELLGVSLTRANQLMHKAIRNNPATKQVRQTLNEKGVKKYEMHRGLYESELASRPSVQPSSQPQAVSALPLGANPQQDGTIAQVFTEEEYQRFTEALIEWKMLKNQISQHEAEIERLQATYEDHIATYESQTNYLRERLHKNEEVTTKLIALMEQRNYIEASNTKTTNQ